MGRNVGQLSMMVGSGSKVPLYCVSWQHWQWTKSEKNSLRILVWDLLAVCASKSTNFEPTGGGLRLQSWCNHAGSEGSNAKQHHSDDMLHHSNDRHHCSCGACHCSDDMSKVLTVGGVFQLWVRDVVQATQKGVQSMLLGGIGWIVHHYIT